MTIDGFQKEMQNKVFVSQLPYHVKKKKKSTLSTMA